MVLESNTLDFLFLNDGEKGVHGEKGDDGKTLYTWIKYSQNSDGSNMTDDPTDAIYIGLSYNNESATESNNPSDYKWTKIKGNDGEQGNDAYSILLTNENISFATDVNKKPLSNQSHTCEVIVLQGTEVRTDFTIGTITSVTGISTSVSNRVITLSSTTSTPIASDSGKISIPIIVDGTLFTKIITFSVSKQGIQGENGLDSKGLDLYSSKYAISFDSEGKLKDTSNIILTANQQNFTDTITWSTIPSVSLGTVFDNANQRTLSPSLFIDNNQIQVIITSDDLSDIITIVKVQDGIKGDDGTSVTIKGSYTLDEWNSVKDSLVQSATAGDGYIVDGDLYTFDGTTFVNCGQIKGDKGDSGEDAYTIILSNESHTFVGDTDSALASNTRCDVMAFKGTTQVPVTIGTISGLPIGMTAPISNNGTINAYFSPTVTTSMTTKNGIINIPITVDNMGFTKYFSYSLALKGDRGGNGISVSSVEVYYYLSTSSTELIGGSWSTERPTWVDGKYIWSKQKTTLSNGSSSETDPVCITGGTGATGDTGRGVESITTEYYLSTSKTEQIGGEWSENQPEWSSGHYVWTRSKIVYSNPTSVEYTSPICDTTWEAMQAQIDTVTKTISEVEVKVDKNTKSITEKVWQSDITNSINNYDGSTAQAIRDRVSKTETDISGITSTVSDIKTSVSKKADGSTVTELQKTVTENKQDADSFKQTVKETYATKDSLNDYATTSQVSSAIEQKANIILGTVTDSEGNTTTYQGTLAGLASQVKDNENRMTQIEQTSEEISLKAGTAQKLAIESKTLSVNLSVETMTVATDTDGNNGSYSNCKTSISVMYGIEDVTSDVSITCAPSDGIEYSINLQDKTCSITNMTYDNGYVDINASYIVTIDGVEKTLVDTSRFSVSKSKQGNVGATGESISIISVTPEYYLSTSETEVIGGSWTETPPVKTKTTYIWKREHTVFDDNTEAYSSAVLDASLNKLFEVTAELTVSQEAITAEIKDAKGSSTTLKARLEGIDASVQNVESNATSLINQRADSIETKVLLKQDVDLTTIRYVRDWLFGNSINDTNYWLNCEISRNNVNIASGITPSGYYDFNAPTSIAVENPSYYTDDSFIDSEERDLTKYTSISYSGWCCLQIDLGEAKSVDYIRTWHYYSDERKCNHKLQISKDGTNWYTLYDSELQGGYTESNSGKTYILNEAYITEAFSQIRQDINGINLTVSNMGEENANDAWESAVASLEGRVGDTENAISNETKERSDAIESLNQQYSNIEIQLNDIKSTVQTINDDYAKKSEVTQTDEQWKVHLAKVGLYDGDDVEHQETNFTISEQGAILDNGKGQEIRMVANDDANGLFGYYNGNVIFKVTQDLTMTERILVNNGADFTTIKYVPRTYNGVGCLMHVKSGGTS